MDDRNIEPRHAVDPGRLVGGLVLMTAGALLCLERLGHLDAGLLFDYWPLLLALVGLAQLLGGRSGGVVLLVLGIVLQLDLQGRFEIYQTWPLVLIAVGITLVLRSLRSGRNVQRMEENSHV